jgi:hypothetical protein
MPYALDDVLTIRHEAPGPDYPRMPFMAVNRSKDEIEGAKDEDFEINESGWAFLRGIVPDEATKTVGEWNDYLLVWMAALGLICETSGEDGNSTVQAMFELSELGLLTIRDEEIETAEGKVSNIYALAAQFNERHNRNRSDDGQHRS